VTYKILTTRGQILYEWVHPKTKFKRYDLQRLAQIFGIEIPEGYPPFEVVAGSVEPWEQV